MGKASGGLMYRPAVADGPSDHTPRVASGPDFQWENLGGIQPRHGQPGCAEDCGVQEDEKDGPATDTGGARVIGFGVDCGAGESTGAEHTDTLADGTPIESPATADPIQREDAD